MSIAPKVDRAKAAVNHEERDREAGNDDNVRSHPSSLQKSSNNNKSKSNLLNTINPGGDANTKDEYNKRNWLDKVLPWGLSAQQLKR